MAAWMKFSYPLSAWMKYCEPMIPNFLKTLFNFIHLSSTLKLGMKEVLQCQRKAQNDLMDNFIVFQPLWHDIVS
jgi:hypothetical protein